MEHEHENTEFVDISDYCMSSVMNNFHTFILMVSKEYTVLYGLVIDWQPLPVNAFLHFLSNARLHRLYPIVYMNKLNFAFI